MWCHLNIKCKIRKLEIECSNAILSLTSSVGEKEFQALEDCVEFYK
jgi:hypothetical protein